MNIFEIHGADALVCAGGKGNSLKVQKVSCFLLVGWLMHICTGALVCCVCMKKREIEMRKMQKMNWNGFSDHAGTV